MEGAGILGKRIGNPFSRKKSANILQDTNAEKAVVAELHPDNLSNPTLEIGVSPVAIPTPIKDVTIIESYPLNEPYSYVHITKDVVGGKTSYAVEEPSLSEENVACLQRLKGILNDVLQLKTVELQTKQLAGEYLVGKCEQVFDDYRFNLDAEV